MGFDTVKRGSTIFINLFGAQETEKDEDFKFKITKGKEVSFHSRFYGYLKSVKADSFKYKGKPKNGYKLYMSDGDDSYIFSSSFSKHGISILNSIAGIEDLSKKIYISAGVNKNGYKTVYVNVEGIDGLAKWKFSVEEQNKFKRKVLDPETNEYIRTDTSKLEEALLAHIDGINSRIGPEAYLQSSNKEEGKVVEEKEVKKTIKKGKKEIEVSNEEEQAELDAIFG